MKTIARLLINSFTDIHYYVEFSMKDNHRLVGFIIISYFPIKSIRLASLLISNNKYWWTEWW